MPKRFWPRGWLILLTAACLFSGYLVWIAPKAQSDKRTAASPAPAPVDKTASAPGHTEVAGTASETKPKPATAPAVPSLPPPGDKPKSRWLEGETLWTSPIAKSPDGKLSRVRLLKTTFQHPLIRVEEQLSPGANGGDPTITQQNAMVADHLLVKAAPGVDAARLAEAVRPMGGSVLSQLPGSEIYLIHITSTDGQSLPDAIQALGALKDVIAYAEPDHLARSTATPSDTRFAEQWSLHNIGQNSGTVDADIDGPEAWDVTTGSSSVVVAVLDSGVEYTHADLAANIWTNPGEIAGNGVDDDGNGYTDDVRGWNFLELNYAPLDPNGHGTHVAGIIGAVGNNGAGTSGVAWQVKLMPLKFLDIYGYGTISAAVSAINYARTKGAHIINHSWGVGTYSQSLKDAIDGAEAAGILSVCAADNGNGTNEDLTPNYPASLANASVLSVANTTSLDTLSSTSNYGPTTVDLGAPGSAILSTARGGGYELKSGTSMATPHVSGIAALLKAARPAYTAATIKAIIMASVDPLPGLAGKVVTEGRANAATALGIVGSIGATPAVGVTSTGNRGGPFSAASVTYTVKNFNTAAVSWTASLPAAPWASVVPTSGTLAAGATASITVTINTTLANSAVPGLHARTLTITDTTNSRSITRRVSLDVRVPYIYSYDLASDPGWSREGWWQYGVPTGRGGGSSNPNPDPSSGATGTKVFGTHLNGNIPPEPYGTYSLTAGPLDLRGYTGNTLQFQRWLNTSLSNWGGYHRLQMSTNGGSNWTTLWDTSYYASAGDTAWTPRSYPLGTNADNAAAVLIRWSYDAQSDSSLITSGWNIDDIQIQGLPGKRLFLDGVAATPENSGTAVLTLHVEPPAATPLTVALVSSDTSAVTLPASVTVPANTSSMAVTATLVDDALLDGAQTAVLTVSTSDYNAIPWSLAATDNETTSIALAMPGNATEGNAYIQGVVTLGSAPARDVRVMLASASPLSASVPVSVTVRAGQTKASFPITAPQNYFLEGTKSIQITASVGGWTTATSTLTLADDESAGTPLTLVFPYSAGSYNYAEKVPTVGFEGTVTLGGPRLADTVVTLTHNGGARITLPATVTIPAGTTSATVSPITVADDALKNGVAFITVTAAATSLPNSTAAVTVADDEIHSLVLDTIPSPQVSGGTVTVVLRAQDVNGRAAAGFGGVASITGLNSGAADPAFTPSNVTFVKGIVSQSVTLPTASAAYSLRATSGSTIGSSNTFAVGGPQMRGVNLAARDLAYDPGTNRLYASTDSGTVVPIHPVTGALETPITLLAGSSVIRIRISDSGSIMYALLSGNGTYGNNLVRVNLATRAVGTPFSFPTSIPGYPYPGYSQVADFVQMPGAPDTLVVSLYSQYSPKLQVYVNGVKAAAGVTAEALDPQNLVDPYYLAVGNQPGRVYASGRSRLYQLTANTSGISLVRNYTMPEDLGRIEGGPDSTRLLSATGRVVDAETGVPLGRLFNAGSNAGYSSMHGPSGRAVTLAQKAAYSSYDLRIWETSQFSETSCTAVADAPAWGTRMARTGNQGIAYLTASQVVLVSTPDLPDPAATAPDIAIAQVPGPAKVAVGEPLSFNLLVRNNGNASASNVVVTNRRPAGTSLVTAATTRGTAASTEETTTFQLGTLAPGETATASVTVRAVAGTLVNTAQVTTTTAESFLSNNLSSANVMPVASSYASPRKLLDLGATSLAATKMRGRVLASLGPRSGFFAGTVAIIDPVTGAVLSFLPTGGDPGALAIADGENSATVALNGTGQLLPLDMATLQPGTPYTLGTSADGRNLLVNEMVAVPGRSDRFAIARRTMGGANAGAALYQGATQIGTATAAGTADQSLAFGADATELFGHTDSTLFRMSVSESGLAVQVSATDQSARHVRYANGRLITSYGRMVRASDLVSVGRLNDSLSASDLVSVDPARGRIYTAGLSFVSAHEDVNFTRVLSMTPFDYGYDPFTALVRWGATGIAYMNNLAIYAYNNEPAAFVPSPQVSVVMLASVAENAGLAAGAGSVRLTDRSAMDVAVSLQSENFGLLQVPASVTIPAGQLSASFDVTVTDDAIFNGGRQVSVVPYGVPGYAFQAGTTQVADNETTTVSFTAPSNLAETSGVVTGQARVTIGRPAEADIAVRLYSSDTGILTVPATVTIPYGQTMADVPLTVLNDLFVRGARNVTLTASIAGWGTENRTVAISDDENAVITISIQSTFTESTSYVDTTVALGGKVDEDVVVTITNSHPSRLSTRSTATISAGTSSTTYSSEGVRNTDRDGRQTVTLTAVASGFTPGTASVVVQDDDVGAFSWDIPANVPAGVVTNITAYGKTIDGDAAPLNSGTSLALAASRDGLSLPLISTALTNNSNYPDYSKLTGTASLTSAGPNAVLSLVYGGTTYASQPFTVVPGPHASFTWNPIDPAGPQPGTAIPLTVKAADVYGNAVPGFSGTAGLTAVRSLVSKTVGTGTQTSLQPLHTGYQMARYQMIYLASELTPGPAAGSALRSLALQIYEAPGRAYDQFTLRVKHTSRTAPDSAGGWDNSGWTTLRQGGLNLQQRTGWVVIPLDTTFNYDGTSNLALEIIFNNTGATSNYGLCYSTATSSSPTMGSTGNSGNWYGDPLYWTTSPNSPGWTSLSNSRPNIRFDFGSSLAVTPPTTGAFANGSWTGSVTFPTAASNVMLTATSGTGVNALFGDSNLFDVGALPPGAPVLTAMPSFTGGTSRSLAWDTVTAATSYQVEAATDSSFTTVSASSGWISASSHTFTGLTSGTRYYFRVKARKSTLEGAWGNTVETTMDSTGPVIGLGNSDLGEPTAFTTVQSSWVIAGRLSDAASGLWTMQILLNSTSYPWTFNADGTWALNLTIPSAGTYAVSFRATDAAGNITQRDATITRKADTDANGLPDDWQSSNGLTLSGPQSGRTADFDGDGRSNLLEYAFNTPANKGTGTPYPTATPEANSADGKTYVLYRYDRRRGAVDLTYNLEFSSNLSTWSSSSLQTEPVGTPVLNPDGVTERVTVRILPDISQSQAQKVFVRLSVTSLAP